MTKILPKAEFSKKKKTRHNRIINGFKEIKLKINLNTKELMKSDLKLDFFSELG